MSVVGLVNAQISSQAMDGVVESKTLHQIQKFNVCVSLPNRNGFGSVFNADRHELCPFVDTDGKHLYYTSRRDIYRIDASIIDTLRKP